MPTAPKIHKAANKDRSLFACGIWDSAAPSRRGWVAVTCAHCLKKRQPGRGRPKKS